jgi:hypothetical protein
MPISSVSVWASAHQEKRPHLVKDIHFAELGQDSRVECACGWRDVGPTHEHIEHAYWQHRKDLGLHAEIMTIATIPWL